MTSAVERYVQLVARLMELPAEDDQAEALEDAVADQWSALSPKERASADANIDALRTARGAPALSPTALEYRAVTEQLRTAQMIGAGDEAMLRSRLESIARQLAAHREAAQQGRVIPLYVARADVRGTSSAAQQPGGLVRGRTCQARATAGRADEVRVAYA
ncbi:MAG: hypothetical protein HY908_05005 [Myxococcales bacterium]|nr:hypothetical protein [Myxococcales bacterium]